MLIEQIGLPKDISELIDAAINYGYSSGDSDVPREELVKCIKEIKRNYPMLAGKETSILNPEPLGEPFQKVLDDHREELYEEG